MPTIHNGDCIETMKAMPPESVDAIVTDPPYNLSNGSKSDAQCFREIVTEVLLPHNNNRDAQGVESRDLAVPSLSGADLGGERRPVRVDARVGVPEGPVDLQGASIAEHEVHAGDEAPRSAPHGFHHPPAPHSCDGCWCEGERDREQYGWDHNTAPTMDDLRRAGIEARLHPIRRRIDEMVAALPWHGRLIYRLALPIARLAVRRKP